ncbi:MAG: S1 RNA-binding domain-containing protein [Chloroflexi bacterium]|nr:S1 RNA-binding domain-containing protein [Chloroflexota bacterium]
MAKNTVGETKTHTDALESGMKELLEKEAYELRTPHRGSIEDGAVVRVDREGVWVDIGYKSEGLIPLHEMRSMGPHATDKIDVGQEVTIYVLQVDNDEGRIILSLDRALGEKGWRTLQQRFENNEIIEADVIGYNKGGLLVNVEGVHGFVPISHLVELPVEKDGDGRDRLGLMVGKHLRLKIIEMNRRRNRLILSERAALQEWRMQQRERLLEEIHEGEIRRGRVTSIRNFGAFIDLGGADGLAPVSELSWEHVDNPESVLKVGEEVDVYVMRVDPETKKIALSLRRASPESWEGIIDKYDVGQLINGTITKLASFGAFARIEGPVEGLIHISELSDHHIVHPKEVVKEGDSLTLKIVRIEKERHRLGLSLKQAQEEVGRE